MFEFMIDTAVKGAVLLVLAVIASALLRNAAAATRHFVWVVCATSLVVLPFLASATPRLGVLPARESAKPVTTEWTASDIVAEPPAASGEKETAEAVSPTPPAEQWVAETQAKAGLSLAQTFLFVWLTGMMLVLATIAFGFARVRSLSRNADRVTRGPLFDHVTRVAREMGVTDVVVLEGDADAMPMTWGILTPKLLLPSAANAWPHNKLEAVLRHEIAHIRRSDPLWQLVGEAACAMHWFNPLAWHAVRRMRVEREHACDDEVLIAGSRASDYAAELLEIARSLRTSRATSLAAIAMAHPRQLEGRLLAVLDESRERRGPARKWPLWLAAAAIVLPIAALGPRTVAAIPTEASMLTREPPANNTRKAAERPRPATPRTKTDTAPPKQASLGWVPTPSPVQQRCFGEDVRSVSVNTNSEKNSSETSWETKRCKGSLKTRGAVRIAGDLSGIESIASGGELFLWEYDGEDKRKLTVTPSQSGRLEYAYNVNGKNVAWGSEGQLWLREALSYMSRRVGFGREERIDHLMRQGGYTAVLKEIEGMESDWVQGQYFEKLLTETTLNATALEKVLNVAARKLESDHELAKLLMKVAEKNQFTEATRNTFIAATRTLQSDYEHRRTLSAVLTKGGLSSDNVAAVLESMYTIGSDHERSTLLRLVIEKQQLDPANINRVLDLTDHVGSDYEQARVLRLLMEKSRLGRDQTARLRASIEKVGSDYERNKLIGLLDRQTR